MNTKNQARLAKVRKFMESQNLEFSWAPDYVEPGYASPKLGIYFANWNPTCGYGVPKARQERDHMARCARAIESLGGEIEWSDEWATCGDCQKAFRTSPDSYSWTPYFRWVGECSIVCLDCLDQADYLESIEDDPTEACPPEWDLTEHGYTKHNGIFETGFHPGQNDSPEAILGAMHSQGLKHVVFKLVGSGQFDVQWEAFHKIETEED